MRIENFARNLSSRLLCSATALNLSSPSGKGAIIAFSNADPAMPSSSLFPGSSASIKIRWCSGEMFS